VYCKVISSKKERRRCRCVYYFIQLTTLKKCIVGCILVQSPDYTLTSIPRAYPASHSSLLVGGALPRGCMVANGILSNPTSFSEYHQNWLWATRDNEQCNSRAQRHIHTRLVAELIPLWAVPIPLVQHDSISASQQLSSSAAQSANLHSTSAFSGWLSTGSSRQQETGRLSKHRP
jgi:hypothetical protein